VVLNSLSSTMLQFSLDCVASYGHFCEIGKYDIQENSRIGLRAFERNMSFHGIDLSDMFDKPRVWAPVRDLLIAGLASGEVVPLDCRVFGDPEEALRVISSGKHIGKILVQIPPLRDIEHLGRRSFRTSGTHLVVGGLGGFGLEVVSYLYSRGAEQVIVVSRRQPDAYQRQALQGATVVNANLVDVDVCNALLHSLGAQLVGVWQLAMVLNDRLFSNMTDDAWTETVECKANILANLDLSSRAHCPRLAHFVAWSSVTALFGNAGQTNYAYANSSMEGVCMRRRAEGLCGLAIQWGLIGAVGVMVDRGVNESFKFAPQHIDSCLEVLDDLLFCDHAVVASYLPAEICIEASSSITLSEKIARILGICADKIKGSDSLASLGMDSLQSVEVVNLLKTAGKAAAVPDIKAALWAQIKTLDA
jgi:fatty acid synthase